MVTLVYWKLLMLCFETHRHRGHASGASPAIIMCIHNCPLLGRFGFRLGLLGESEKESWEKIKWCEAQHLPPTPTPSELLVQNDLIWLPCSLAFPWPSLAPRMSYCKRWLQRSWIYVIRLRRTRSAHHLGRQISSFNEIALH